MSRLSHGMSHAYAYCMQDNEHKAKSLSHLDGIRPIDHTTIAALASDERVGRDIKATYRVICRVTGRLLGAYPTLGGASACAALSMLDGVEPMIVTHRVGKGE